MDLENPDQNNTNNTMNKEGRRKSINVSQNSEKKYELEISFWDMNPKEHLWSRLKSLELFETANILLMIYNADDRDSYEKII